MTSTTRLTALLALAGLSLLLAACGSSGPSYDSRPISACPYSDPGLAREGQAVVVRSGQVPTGGWSFAVKGVETEGETLVVEAELTPPEADAVVTQALVNHCLRLTFADGLGDLQDWRLRIEGDPRGTRTVTGRL